MWPFSKPKLEPVICAYCKHSNHIDGKWRCQRPLSIEKDIVTGKPSLGFLNFPCREERKDYPRGYGINRCGPEGKYYSSNCGW